MLGLFLWMLCYNNLAIVSLHIPQWIVLRAIKPGPRCFIIVTDSEINNNKKYIWGANMLLSTESKLDLLETRGSSCLPQVLPHSRYCTVKGICYCVPELSPRSHWRQPASLVSQKQYSQKPQSIVNMASRVSKMKLLWIRVQVHFRHTIGSSSSHWRFQNCDLKNILQ